MPIYKSLVRKVSIPAQNKIKQKDYLPKGAYPVIDQGHELIGGYTDDLSKLVRCRLPVIVFGDHTKAVKYITFTFAAGADGIKVLEVAEGIDPRFLFYATKYLTYKIENKGYARHYQFVEKKGVSIPELPEQQRIVARIEELFSQLDDAEATLQKTKAQLALYRQAVLKEAFLNISMPYSSCFVEDVCDEIKVGIVIKPAQYYTSSDNGIKAFRSANVREFRINDADWVYLTKEGHESNKRSEIHTGNVLVVRSGYPGTACVVTKEYDGCNAIDILIAVPNQKKVLPEYLCAYTNSPLGKKTVHEKKRGVAQAHFNVSGYSKTPIIIPSLEEQIKVLQHIESRLTIQKSIEMSIDDTLDRIQALKQSILRKEYEGE